MKEPLVFLTLHDYSRTAGIGKRSAPIEDIHEEEDILPLEEGVFVEKYPVEELKNRRRRSDCDEERLIVIILDVSGSIRSQEFMDQRQLIATIAENLCGNIQIAVVSYSNDINLDFCSNCYNINMRSDMKDAILNIHHQSAGTHTGRALKCVGEEVVKPTGICRLSSNIKHIDIVTLTDGRHNGPCTSSIPSIVNALDGTALNVKRYVIGYGNVYQPGLNALASQGDIFHVFYITRLTTLAQKAAIISALPDCSKHRLPCK